MEVLYHVGGKYMETRGSKRKSMWKLVGACMLFIRTGVDGTK